MEFDLRTLVNAVAGSIGTIGQQSPDARREIWQKAQGFAVSLLNAATTRWIPFYTEQRPCHLQALRAGVAFPCNQGAILACDACGNPVCIEHAQVDAAG